ETGTIGAVFLIKLDIDGNIVWKRQFGPPNDIEIRAIRTDLEGNCYIVGYTSEPFGNQQGFGGEDAFLVKFTGSGELAWVKILGTSQTDRAEALTIDEEGSCYVTGTTGGGSGRRSSPPAVLLTKYDPNGVLIWESKPEITNAETGQAISILPDGNIVTAGLPGYMARLDPNGVLIDASTVSLGHCSHMTFDDQGSLYACGARQASNWTAHVQKHDPNGLLLWHKTFRDTGWVGAKSIVMCTDGSGEVLMGGCQQAGSKCQAFCRRFDSEGNQTFRYDHPGDTCGNGVGVDGLGSCLLTAYIGPSGGILAVKLGVPDQTVQTEHTGVNY
ncbi:SBBP repeat-containing protein, partial [Planctomycetota bacterium]